MKNNFSLSIDDAAYNKIKSVILSKKVFSYFSINVTSGGCSGFTTSFSIVDKTNEDDLQINYKDIIVIINNQIAEILEEATLTYKTDILNSYFMLDVKKATAKCSCGSSFGL